MLECARSTTHSIRTLSPRMNTQVKVVFLLTFVIHLISTLAFAFRIAGVRTRRIAVSFTVFNILVLVSRTANTFQGPLLAKHVEQNIIAGASAHIESDFRWLLLSSTLATLVGLLLIPTTQRLFTRAIDSMETNRSLPRLFLRLLAPSNWRHVRESLKLPASKNITQLSWTMAAQRILIFQVLATALLTVGVFASLYAGYLKPDLRVTANNLSPVVNAVSTILLFLFIDPYLSFLTDDVVQGKATEGLFRRSVVLLAASRLVGTLLAQLIFVPSARVIVKAAELI